MGLRKENSGFRLALKTNLLFAFPETGDRWAPG